MSKEPCANKCRAEKRKEGGAGVLSSAGEDGCEAHKLVLASAVALVRLPRPHAGTQKHPHKIAVAVVGILWGAGSYRGSAGDSCGTRKLPGLNMGLPEASTFGTGVRPAAAADGGGIRASQSTESRRVALPDEEPEDGKVEEDAEAEPRLSLNTKPVVPVLTRLGVGAGDWPCPPKPRQQM